MFTVLSKTRNSSLFLIAGFVVGVMVLWTFAVVPAMSAMKPAVVPATDNLDVTSDYYQRHPELRTSAVTVVDLNGDLYLRHPEGLGNVPIAAIPLTGSSELSDYFQRHLELSTPAGIAIDTAGYFLRHPEWRPAAPSTDLADYFLRH